MFVGGILPILAVAFCNWRIVRIVGRRTPELSLKTARRVSVYALLVGLCAGGALLLGVGGAIFSVLTEQFNDAPGFVGIGMFGLLYLFCQIPSFRVVGQIRNLADDNQDNLELTIDRSAGWIERWGWVNLVLAGLLFSMLIVPMFLVAILFLLFGLPALIWQRQRARESQLLWLLALATRHNRDLTFEVKCHARGWTGFHACRLRELATYLASGQSLGIALQMVPHLLPPWAVAAILTAEETGTLNQTLTESATGHVVMMKERYRTGSPAGLIVMGVTYLSATTGIVAFLCYFIVPKYEAIFEGFGTELPWETVLFIQASHVVANYFYLFMWFPLFLLWLVHVDHRGWRTLKMRLLTWFYPLFDASGVLRQLAHTIERNQPISHGLLSLANCHYRPSVAETMAQVYVEVESGDDPWQLLHHNRFVTRRDLAVIQTAERVGNLPWALREVAHLRERRLQHQLDLALTFLRPALVLLLGVLVGIVCYTMFLPLIKVTSDLS